MKTQTKIMACLVVCSFLFSCNFNVSLEQVKGKGEVTTQEHQLEPFTQVNAENGWDVVLKKAEHPKLIVKANENLHPILEFSVENEVLHIASKEDKNIGDADAKTVVVLFSDGLQKIEAASGAEISSPEVFEQEKITLHASSGAEITLKLKTNRVIAEASSGSEIELKGTTTTFEADASSGAEINAKNLESQQAVADASSGAEINLNVSEDLTGGASSGGEVNYYGAPASVSIDNSVSGDVNKR